MADNDAGWVPRPHPESVLFARLRGSGGVETLVGSARGKTCWVKENGTYVLRDTDGTLKSGRWTE